MYEFKLRACLVCFNSNSHLLDIDSDNLRDTFFTLAGLQPADGLVKTQYLCEDCSELVRKFHEFREKCGQARITLQEILAKANQVISMGGSLKNVSINTSPHLISLEKSENDSQYAVKLEPPDPIEEPNKPFAHVLEPVNHMVKVEYMDETPCLSKQEITIKPDLHPENYDDNDNDNENYHEEEVHYTRVRYSHSDSQLHKVTCGVCCKKIELFLNVDNDILIDREMIAEKFVCQSCLPTYKANSVANKKVSKSRKVKVNKKFKGTVTTTKKRKRTRKGNDTKPNFNRLKIKDLEDFMKYTPVTHEEQYKIVNDRKLIKSERPEFQCPFCYKSHRLKIPFDNHMKKHDPTISGNLQCDVCKEYKIKKHAMNEHMYKRHINRWTCLIDSCRYVCYNRCQAVVHYRYHKNIIFQCPYCSQNFNKPTTYLSHVRLKHPSLNIICNLCGNSFVGKKGILSHRVKAHTKEEVAISDSIVIDPTSELYCSNCTVQFVSETAFKEHLRSSCKLTEGEPKPKVAGPPRRRNPSGAPRRRRPREKGTGGRPGRPRGDALIVGGKKYMCDVCGRTLTEHANLVKHMRVHTKEKPFDCPHCDRKFSIAGNRDRHIRVHTGEKPFMCQYCSRSFTQRNSMKLHIQTVHLKIPYEPWIRNSEKKRLAKLEREKAPMIPTTSIKQDYQEAFATYNED